MSKAECTVCLLVFAGDRDFDKHRVGNYEPEPGTRRCLTVAEMKAGEPKNRVKRHGRWVEPLPTPWHLNRNGHWSSRDPQKTFPHSPGAPSSVVEAGAAQLEPDGSEATAASGMAGTA